MLDRLKKLDVGDIVVLDRRLRDRKRKELIELYRGLYGDDMPDDAIDKINYELTQISIGIQKGKFEIDLDTVQFLVWRSLLKSDPDVTIEEAGSTITMENASEHIDKIMPVPGKVPAKKKVKKARKKKKKNN
jgi:hypothetical protein